MANNPIPDNSPKLMKADHGTVVLITDPRSDKYMIKATKQKLAAKKAISDAWTI